STCSSIAWKTIQHFRQGNAFPRMVPSPRSRSSPGIARACWRPERGGAKKKGPRGPFFNGAASISNAAALFAGTGLDLDVVTGRHEERHLQLEAVGDLRGLHHLARRVALDRGLRVAHFADN